ncbi:MAG: DNA primase, partial [Candidatus Levyibacteriota bacterium]
MDQVSEIRNKIDIVALIQEFVPLKKMGRNFKANCPFHGEKTPSFVVSPERQIWHCFGCNKGGDVYTFLMEYEHMEFPEALRILADRAGVRLVNQAFDTGVSSKKETIYKLNRLAAEFYHYLLVKHQLGKIALSYVLERRHIKTQTLNTFLLGFAPQTGNALTTYLVKKKGYKKEDILEAGLATQRGSQLYDFFQGRLMFPLFDHRDNIIGFSGRILEDNEKTSKYINTRDTLAYHKGMTFFGLNSAKQAIKKEQNAILMEGEFDVISSFQEGITNAVAVKGTALTQDQVSLLARFTPMISLCFDTDSAGQEAFKRSLPL